MQQNSLDLFQAVDKLLKNKFPEARNKQIVKADWIGYSLLNNSIEINEFLYKQSNFAFDINFVHHGDFAEIYCSQVKNLNDKFVPLSEYKKLKLAGIDNEIIKLHAKLEETKEHNLREQNKLHEIENLKTEIVQKEHEKTKILDITDQTIEAKTTCRQTMSYNGRPISEKINEYTMKISNDSFAPKVLGNRDVERLKDIKITNNIKNYECTDPSKLIHYKKDNLQNHKYSYLTEWIISFFFKPEIIREISCIDYENIVEIELNRQYFYPSIYKKISKNNHIFNRNYCLIPTKAYIMINPKLYISYKKYNKVVLEEIVPDSDINSKIIHDRQFSYYESFSFEKDFNVISYEVENYCNHSEDNEHDKKVENLIKDRYSDIVKNIDGGAMSNSIEREKELDLIRETLVGRTSPNIFIVCGLDGIGKKSLVREFVSKYKEDFSLADIWINAENIESFKKAMRSFALLIDIGDETNSLAPEAIENKIVKKLFKSDETHILMIFQNVNTKTAELVKNFLRKFDDISYPVFIITNNLSAWQGYKKGIWREEPLIVKPMPFDDEEIVRFVTKKLRGNEELYNFTIENAKSLGTSIGRHPGVLDSAINHIINNQLTINDYIQIFNKTKRNGDLPSELLEQNTPLINKYNLKLIFDDDFAVDKNQIGFKLDINGKLLALTCAQENNCEKDSLKQSKIYKNDFAQYTIFNEIKNALERKDDEFDNFTKAHFKAQILHYIFNNDLLVSNDYNNVVDSYTAININIGSDAIEDSKKAKKLMKYISFFSTENIALSGLENEANDYVLNLLNNYSLIYLTTLPGGKKLISVPKIVQDVIKIRLKKDGKYSETLEQAMLLVRDAVKMEACDTEPEIIKKSKPYEYHLYSLLEHYNEIENPSENLSKLAAELYDEIGNLNLVSSFATVAIEYFEKSLEIRENITQHRDVNYKSYIPYERLALSYYSKGNYAKSESYINLAYSLIKNNSSIDEVKDTDIARLMQFNGKLLFSNSQFNKAETCFEKSQALYNKTSKFAKPLIEKTNDNLNFCKLSLIDLRTCDDGVKMENEVASLSTTLKQENGACIVFTTNNLASSLLEQGKLDNALMLLDKNLIAAEEIFGKNHPEIATIYNLQGNINKLQYSSRYGSSQEPLNEAISKYIKAIDILKISNGLIDKDLVEAVINLSEAYRTRHNSTEVLSTLDDFLKELNYELKGKKHPLVAMILIRIGITYTEYFNEAKSYQLAYKKYDEAEMQIDEKISPELAEIMARKARVVCYHDIITEEKCVPLMLGAKNIYETLHDNSKAKIMSEDLGIYHKSIKSDGELLRAFDIEVKEFDDAHVMGEVGNEA